MTFDEIVSAVQAPLNLTSTESTTRIGKLVNVHYKRLTSSLGLITTRRTTVQATATLGVATLVFSNIEKIINVVDRSTTPYRMLSEVTVEELRNTAPVDNTYACKYAVLTNGASSVTILMDVEPQSAFTLYADGHANLSTLSGSQVPAFAESYHDILVYAVLTDEYRKMMQRALSKDCQGEYESRLSDLRMWLAKSSYLDITQGGLANRSTGLTVAGGGTGTSSTGGTSYTQTGLITFDRTSATLGSRYPFAVAVGSEKVANLDADLLDGLDSTAFLQTTGGTLTGDLKFTDALYDIGKSGATRPRDLFISRNAVVGGSLAVTSTTTLTGNIISDLKFTDATYDIGKTGATRPRDGFFSRNVEIGGTIAVTGNVVADLKFTDATYDIGKSAATRPRDLFLSRNATVGGTLGVTGTSTIAGLIGGWTVVTTSSTGAQNDFAPGLVGHTVLRCNNATALTISGFTGGFSGQRLIVQSIGVGQVLLTHQTLSTAANQLFNIATSAPTPLAAGSGVAEYVYDATTARWRLVSHTQGAYITPTFAAGDYTGGGTQTWTLQAGDVFLQTYYLSGRSMTVNWILLTTSVGGGAATTLKMGNGLWGGFTSGSGGTFLHRVNDNGGAAAIGAVNINGGATVIDLYVSLTLVANWTGAANTTEVRGGCTFDVT